MFLPRDVTGFDGPSSASGYRAFRGRCHTVARKVGGSLRVVLTPRLSVACNYAFAVIGFRGTEVSVALNGVFPLLAFALPPAGSLLGLDFVDQPDLAAEFDHIGGYTRLLALELNQPFTREMGRNLAPHEQRRVRYFRPQRVGDVVYNHWD